MADNIIKLRVDSSEYESKIKRASQGLQALGQNLRSAGKTFADADKDAVKFASELGKMQTVSNTARGKISELSAAFVNLKSDYLKMTDAEKQSPMGQAMAKSLEQLKARTLDAKRELESLNKELELTSSKASGGGAINQLLGGVAGKFGMSASMFTGVGAAVAGIGTAYKAISDNISTAMGFEKSMSQLSSLTGMVGKDLEQLKEYAIELGSTSTLTASQVADAFRLIGSQQPQLLSSADALKEVTKNAITLSEAAGIDLVTAAQTLSTSINQMGGDSDNAARYVNVLAAASQKGAGDIAWLGEAITKSATAAKAVGTDYEELVANLEQLAKGGFDASTAGTALRSIIMNLEKQANQEFKPSIVGLTQAFENLGKANLDIVGYQEIAGKMFASQAKVLADAADEARNMTTAITGTNTATQQASTNTANLEGSLKSLASAWEGLNLHINSSNGYLKTAVDWLKDVVVWADKAITGLGEVKGNRDKLNGEGNGGQTKVDRMVGNLENTSIDRRQSVYTQQVSAYWKYINEWDKKLKEAESRKDVFAWETIKKNNDIAEAKANIAGAQSMLKEYQSKAQKLLKTSSPSPGKGGSNNGIVVDVDVDTEEGTKNIKELQSEIKKLKKLRDDAASAGDTKLRDQYNAQIKSVQAEIKSMRGTGSTSNKKVTVEAIDGSIDAQTKKVQDLQKAWRAAADDDSRKKIKEQIEQAQTVLDVMNGKTKLADITIKADTSEALEKLKGIDGITIDPKDVTIKADTSEALEKLKGIDGITIDPKDVTIKADTSEALAKIQDIKDIDISISSRSLPGLESELKTLNDQRKTLSDPIDIELIDNQIKDVKDQIDQLNGKKVEIEIVPSTMTPFEQLKQSISIQLAEENMQVDETTLKTLMQTAIQNGIDGLDPNFASLQEKLREGMNIPDSEWEDLQTQINEKLKELGIEPINIDVKTGNLAKDGHDITKAWRTAASAISTVGSAMSGLKDPAIDIMTVIGQSIATVALAYADTLAQDRSSKSNIWAFIAAAAAATVSMATTIASIHSSTGYAQGGIVKGNSYSGDNVPALVDGSQMVGLNAGEVVLTRAMQSNLAGQLQNGGNRIQVVGRLSGEQLFLCAERWSKRTGKGEFVTWR